MRHIKALFCLIFSVALIMPFANVAGAAGNTVTSSGDGSVLVENALYKLCIDSDTQSVYLTDKTGENKWNSIVTDEIYDLSSCSDLFVEYMQSMIVAHYALHTDTNGTVIDAYSRSDSTQVSVKRVSNGADFSYTFTQPEISLTLQVRLTDDGVTFNVPFKTVKEKGNYSLLSLEIAPFFGAAAYDESGYLFYPENTGAITYFQNVPFKSKSSTGLSLDIYGDSNLETIMNETPAAVATMPVYGISRDRNAVFAVATSGEYDAKINVRPAVSTSSMKIHTAGFSFTYHYNYTVYLSNIVRNGKNSSGNINGSKVDKKSVTGDRTVRFFLLADEKSDYSSMANVYRNYLIKTKQLTKASGSGYNETALTILCGVKSSGELFGNNFVEMTTYKEAASMVKDYYDAGLKNLHVNLKGWSKSGYLSFPQSYSPVAALGGKNGLRQLSKYLKSAGITSTLQCGVIYTTSGLFGIKGKAASKGTGIPVADEEETVYLLSPHSAVKRVKESVFKKYAYYPAFDDIGSILYGTFNSGNRISRSQTAEYWKALLSDNDYVSVQGSNAYVFGYADRLYDVKTNGAKLLICDENIPFTSIVLYGSISMNATPGNCSGNFQEEKLRWIEYGCSPCFEVSQNSPKLLKNTNYNTLFFSKNDSLSQRVKETYTEFHKNLKVLSDSYMIKHERLSDTLVRVTYDNGYTVIINYAAVQAEYEGFTVPAKSYCVYK